MCLQTWRALCMLLYTGSGQIRRWQCHDVIKRWHWKDRSGNYSGQFDGSETLDEILQPCVLSVSQCHNFIFQHGNTRLYAARLTTVHHHANIQVLPWPSRSSDLNPIENLWLDRLVNVDHSRRHYTSWNRHCRQSGVPFNNKSYGHSLLVWETDVKQFWMLMVVICIIYRNGRNPYILNVFVVWGHLLLVYSCTVVFCHNISCNFVNEYINYNVV